jgi:hypothetical protein
VREIVAFRGGWRFGVGWGWCDRVAGWGEWGLGGWHRLCRERPLTERLEEQDGARHRGVQAGDLARHGDADEEVDSPTDGGREAPTLGPDHDAEWPAQVRLSIALGRLGLSADHPNPPQAQGGELVGQVLDAGDQEVLDRSGAGLNSGW